MNKALLSPHKIVERVDDFRKYVNQAFSVKEKDPLHKTWRETEAKLLAILEDNKKRPQVTIALVGGTGAGKSTLVNAMLQAPLLPYGSHKATTAAVCQVDFLDEQRFEAEIIFISRDAWRLELDALLDDLRDQEQSTDPEAGGQEDRASITELAKFKLQAIYGKMDEAELIARLKDRDAEPPEIADAFQRGKAHVVSTDIKDFQKKIEIYLSAKHNLWPIVKCVNIRGPFPALRSGASIVDLPGINDANEAREAVTRHFLKTSRYVWIVFNIKRSLTKDAIHLLQSDDFLRQIVMDGRADALTFIGTASDDIDVENPGEFNLPDDATPIEIMASRNDAVKAEVNRQLEHLSTQLVRAAREDKKRGDILQEAFNRCQMFTVTAKWYLSLLDPHSRVKRFDGVNQQQTQIPSLIKHLEGICAGYGVEAKCESLQNQIDMLWREFYREVQNQQAMLQKKSDITQKQRAEMEHQAGEARKTLDTDLKAAHDSFFHRFWHQNMS